MAMKFYNFADPHDYRFARAMRIGTWSPNPGPGACPKCGNPRQKRVPPLVIEWLPGSDLIGEFTWPSFNDEIVVTQRVREALEDSFCCVRFLPIMMHQNPNVRRPQRPNKRTKPRVWLPYHGVPLWDLQPTTSCQLDLRRSTVAYISACDICGRQILVRPPLERRYLILDGSTWGGEDIFRVLEYPELLFCTERLRRFVESRSFTNVDFHLAGEVLI